MPRKLCGSPGGCADGQEAEQMTVRMARRFLNSQEAVQKPRKLYG